MRHYVALVHKDAGSDFGVSFPDFPGCVTAGSTLDDVAAMAIEALTGHMDLMVEEGEALPEPSTLDAIMSDADHRDGVPVLIAMPARSTRVVRINITLPEDVLGQIDAFAQGRGMNRSNFLVWAARREMREENVEVA